VQPASAIAANIAAPPASGPAAASQVAQAEVAGEPLAALLQTGRDWVMAQQKNDYTVELLRTNDLNAVGNVAPPLPGQPLFLVKIAGQYAVLSGVYANEEAAKRAAGAAGRAAHLSEFQ
jgi:septal ring-binding cell division protein DamX